MNFLTFEQYEKKVQELKSNYWNEGYKYRWKYISKAIEFAKELNPSSVIEAGTSGVVLSNSDKIDECVSDFRGDLNTSPFPTYWPRNITKYDLFIALQTWEHLDNQAEAFREVMRIANAAILSFPYKWKHGDARHRGINEVKIAHWTCGIEPVKTFIVDTRIIYVWDFKK